MQPEGYGKKIAVVGSGISGMSAAWLLSQRHDVTLFEAADRLGGHTNTVTIDGARGPVNVDTGFIVFNEVTYPNLTALFRHLGVATYPSNMSLAVSLRSGGLEYAGTSLSSLFAQRKNIANPRFWSMLCDLVRFYRYASYDFEQLDPETTLREYLATRRYGAAFCNDHLSPMASAIWSAPADTILDYPAAAFIRFFHNHGLLKLRDRPAWRTVEGGSRSYVERLTQNYAHRVRLDAKVLAIRRQGGGVLIRDQKSHSIPFDAVVIATHADQALRLLEDPSPQEQRLLGPFRYTRNHAVLHGDETFMPRRREVWSSWNYVENRLGGSVDASVTYWMNQLQNLATDRPVFVTLNASRPPRAETIWRQETYEHPLFNRDAMSAQKSLWQLQGYKNTWFCGAYFGAGFHEDGLQAGLAVAEQLGGLRRPWSVDDESSRIFISPLTTPIQETGIAA